MIILSHPTGNQNVRQALQAFLEANLLAEFVTTVATFEGNIFDRLAKTKMGKEFNRRRYNQELAPITTLQPNWDLSRMIAKKIGASSLTKHETGLFSVDAVYRNLDLCANKRVKKLGQNAGLTAVYGYEDGALEMFTSAKKLGLKCIYDLPIAYWQTSRTLLDEEALRLPEWSSTLVGTLDSEKKFKRKDQELELADIIICPSEFVRQSLPEWVQNSKPIHVIPFGSPALALANTPEQEQPKSPLKVLFAGSMTQRKGLADVFEAMQLLDPKQYELHVLGSPIAKLDFYKQQFQLFIHHPSCSHQEVLKLMQACDVFVLPSIVEGRALVQQEAMACGLPIIVTKNAGAEDLVEDGKAGFLIPIRDPQAIAEKLTYLFNNRDVLKEMKVAAYKKSQQVTWQNYRNSLVAIINNLNHHGLS